MHGYYPSGPVQALVLQGQLLHVQEDGDPEETRKVKLIIFVGEIHIKTRTNLPKERCYNHKWRESERAVVHRTGRRCFLE